MTSHLWFAFVSELELGKKKPNCTISWGIWLVYGGRFNFILHEGQAADMRRTTTGWPHASKAKVKVHPRGYWTLFMVFLYL